MSRKQREEEAKAAFEEHAKANSADTIAEPLVQEKSYVPKKYRVLNERAVSIGKGGMTYMVPGQIISEDGFSPELIARLKQQGVQMEEV